ncbi:MAG: 2-C-methyl-D-erythritol 4-phosphate cytidylyltransferase [Ktedonobacterales bacterium]
MTRSETSSLAGDAPPRVGGLLLGSVSAVAPGLAAAEAAQTETLLWSLLAGRAVVAWSLLALLRVPQLDEIVLLVEPGREPAAASVVETLGGYRGRVLVRSSPDPAGEVPLGLDSLSTGCRLVVILPGNLPLISPETIVRGIEVATGNDGSGAVAYLPVRETIKQTEGDIVVSTLPREELALLRSPEVFPRVSLRMAYRMSQQSRSTLLGDPAVVAYSAGMPLVPFLGEPDDILITSRQDLRAAEAFLASRMS